MTKWQIKRVWVPLDQYVEEEKSKFLTIKDEIYAFGSTFDADDTRHAWTEAEQLAADGWELVSAIPRLVGYVLYKSEFGGRAGGGGASTTIGFWLLFKRQLAN